MTIVQIVPRLDDRPDGVGDYARLLADALKRRQGTETTYVVGTPTAPDKRSVEAFSADYVSARTAEAFRRLIDATDGPVLLQLSAYGFARRALPFWLLRGLKEWRADNPDRRLVTVVHEIRAHGPVTSSPFWIGWLQRRVAIALCRLSDAVVTPCEAYAEDLRRGTRGEVPVHHLPVFSTIGEADERTSRRDAIAIFGSGAARAQIYRDHGDRLAALLASSGASVIHDIGTQIATPQQLPIRSHGRVPAETVGRLLSQSMAGLFVYDAARLGKSTICASYAAHGAAPVCLSADMPSDGLEAGRSILMLSDLDGGNGLCQNALEETGRRAREWYKGHALDQQGAFFARLIAGDEGIDEQP